MLDIIIYDDVWIHVGLMMTFTSGFESSCRILTSQIWISFMTSCDTSVINLDSDLECADAPLSLALIL